MSLQAQDWIKYAQDTPIWKELIQCMLDPQRKLPARPNWESRGSSNSQVQTVSLINLTKGRSNPAHGKKEQADDRHLNDAEMKNPPIDNGIQKK